MNLPAITDYYQQVPQAMAYINIAWCGSYVMHVNHLAIHHVCSRYHNLEYLLGIHLRPKALC